jgi:hypothetical protein
MKRTEHSRLPGGNKHAMKRPLLCALVVLSLVVSGAQAAQDTFQNDAVMTYPGTLPNPPVIAATNFINNNEFTINLDLGFFGQSPYFETSDTENYTNNAAITINAGFLFNRRSSLNGTRSPSVNFNNQGTVFCGQNIIVNSTNILSPGQLNVGNDGIIQIRGDDVDLVRGTVAVQSIIPAAGGSGVFGLNTNNWFPSLALQPNSASSAFFPMAPFQLFLFPSVSYFKTDTLSPSNQIVRAVFIQDDSGDDVDYSVYFPDIIPPTDLTADGGAVIEWSGAFQDTASGLDVGNYLYLENNYRRSIATNLVSIGGIPDNFTFYQNPDQIDFGVLPAPEGFVPVLPGSVTNRYSFTSAQLIATTVDTNSVVNHSITNLPGRIELSAAKRMDLSYAQITGMNYLSLKSPVQFDGTAGAYIQSPFSDIDIGVTNGFLRVTNLINTTLGNWSGNVQAWSTSWVQVDDTGVTNTYKVLLVYSNLKPATKAQIQDLKLRASNQVVISDALNIMRSLSSDTRSLTLTTNGAGVGAFSIQGELNVMSGNVLWSSALPNLRNLTNNGAITLQNLAQFIGTANGVVIPSSPAIAATGLLSQITGRTNVQVNNSVTIGTNQYVFVSTLTSTTPANRVKIASSFDGSLSNLIAAVNRSTGAGSKYSSSTKSNVLASAGPLTNHAFKVTARVAGTAGNSIATTLSSATTNLTWNGYTTLHGGVAAVIGSTNTSNVAVPYDTMVNRGLISDQGSTITARNFQNSGTISNGVGSFILNSESAVMTDGFVQAGADVIISTPSLVVSNVQIYSARKVVINVTNLLTDNGPLGAGYWYVGGASGTGLSMPNRPAAGDLLGTTIECLAISNKLVLNTWSARDFGPTAAGYANNQAIGTLHLNAEGAAPRNGILSFTGTGVSNALYVETLELEGAAALTNAAGNLIGLSINTNMVIYYADAFIDGVSVARQINHKNNNRLRWATGYGGYNTSTNMVYPPGVTNVLNAPLVNSPDIDSDGDGIFNNVDPTPVFVPAQVKYGVTLTNRPPLSVRLQWTTVANATNYIYYTTNLAANTWLPFTNFNNYYYGSGLAVTNAARRNWFTSPQSYPGPSTNVWVFDAVTNNTPRFYQIMVQPAVTYPY